jgi:hypothetical protein
MNSHLQADAHDVDGDMNTGEDWPLDLAGNTRVVNDTVDTGCYEDQ